MCWSIVIKEKPPVGPPFLWAFSSDRIPKVTKDVNVHFFNYSSNSCTLYQRIPETFRSYYVYQASNVLRFCLFYIRLAPGFLQWEGRLTLTLYIVDFLFKKLCYRNHVVYITVTQHCLHLHTYTYKYGLRVP